MGLLDGIEKLITEHGSAAILKERIELAKEQYTALEAKLSAAESRIKELESISQNLELESYRLKERIGVLEQQLTERQGERRPEIEEKILSLVAANDGITDRVIAHTLSLNPQIVAFHLTELGSAHLLRQTLRIGQPVTPYHLTQEGRKYLISHGLLI